ncbi:lytic transglycosylase domain-containing protein [Roseomonas sp. AR75]|uniref:lytic transglycosylase domain-containing protein n=1 Tax=Roseomonas sp. AR75 TaxID=2562311 RepID=UPI0014850A6A|nr:lytic transglycosylase domain-containing protein [Roseomonas sp. AR75]
MLAPVPATAEPGRLCRAAIQAAERAAGIPAQLLMAIGRVESGRRDPDTGAFHPWPWTINAEGRGQFFPTKAAAIAAVQQLQAQGVRSIDVGCMQINLRHHPDAFPNLDAAFDPATNARYAARFLTELNASRNDWQRAASAYHSQTPEFAEPYRARVMAAWAQEQARPHPPVALPPPAALARAGGGGAMLSNGAARVALPSGAAPAGRSLDLYRSQPVPIAGRPPLARALPATLPPRVATR